MDIQPILAEQLLTVAGLSLLVAILLKFLVKPKLRSAYGLPPDNSGQPEDPEAKAKYSWTLNVLAVVLGIAFALIAQAVLSTFLAADIVQAVLNGIVGGIVAIGLSEIGANSIGRFG